MNRHAVLLIVIIFLLSAIGAWLVVGLLNMQVSEPGRMAAPVAPALPAAAPLVPGPVSSEAPGEIAADDLAAEEKRAARVESAAAPAPVERMVAASAGPLRGAIIREAEGENQFPTVRLGTSRWDARRTEDGGIAAELLVAATEGEAQARVAFSSITDSVGEPLLVGRLALMGDPSLAAGQMSLDMMTLRGRNERSMRLAVTREAAETDAELVFSIPAEDLLRNMSTAIWIDLNLRDSEDGNHTITFQNSAPVREILAAVAYPDSVVLTEAATEGGSENASPDGISE